MKICIYGAGAGGGHFAVRLARAGHDVSVVARGPHLEAIQRNGLRLLSGADVLEAQVRASDDPAEFGAQDAVIVAVKATALPEVAARLAPLVGKTTSVVFPQNGIPWWYPSGLSAACPPPPPLPAFSLAEVLLSVMRQDQVIGGIIYSANEIVAPGVIRNNSPGHNRMDIGAIDDRQTTAVSDLRNVLNQAGLLSRPVESIREAVWTKLLSNMSGSIIALVTRKKSSACRDDAAMCDIFRKLVREGAAIAAANGFPLEFDPDAMLSRLVDHKPSILQDYEQNRQMEIAEILLAPLAFARATSVATPTLDVFAALAKDMAVERGLASA